MSRRVPHVVVIGAGVWGQRVYGKLDAIGVDVSGVEPIGASRETWDASADHRPTHAIIAVPPAAQKAYAEFALERFESLTDLRLEKPGCACEDELLDVLAMADRKDVQVSIGYTLAANPAHCAVRAQAAKSRVVSVRAARWSTQPARHEVSAMLDLGSHAAFLGAWLGADDVVIDAEHDADRDVRTTTYTLEDGSQVIVDEVSQLVSRIGTGVGLRIPELDALAYELTQFVVGTPLVMGEVAIDAHRIMVRQEAAA